MKSQLSVNIKFKNVDPFMDLSRNAMRVYVALGKFADFDDGFCWPTYKTLKATAHITSGSRLHKAIQELIAAGLLDSDCGYKRTYTRK